MKEIRITIYSEFESPTEQPLIALVSKCFIQALEGTKDRLDQQLFLPRSDLFKIRQLTRPDLILLRTVGNNISQYFGQNVWNAIRTSIGACKQFHPEEKMRIAIDIKDSAIREIDLNIARADEIPVELICDRKQNNQFYGLNLITPIVRVVDSTNQEAESIPIPLRILVVVSTPKDRPDSSMEKEINVIKNSLSGYLANEQTGTGGMLWVKWCKPGTKSKFKQMFTDFNPHIIHFIGHGGFEPTQEGDVPQGFLAFQRESDNKSDPMYAEDLGNLVRNSYVRLMIMTACSSAQNAPLEKSSSDPYNTIAFEGIAQKLISGDSRITAVVAMQFDIEDVAIEFSKTFYEELVKPKVTIEEVVTKTRLSISTLKTTGHPSWVCPVLFSRSKDGIVFDIQYMVNSFTNQEDKEISNLDTEIRIYREEANTIYTFPQEKQQLFKESLDRYLQHINNAEGRRSQLLGNSIRLKGTRAKKVKIKLSISLRARNPMNIKQILFDIHYLKNIFLNPSVLIGKDIEINPLVGINLIENNSSNITVTLQWLQNAQQFNPNEYEIAKLSFDISQDAPLGFSEIQIKNVTIYDINNNQLQCRSMSGAVFIED